MINTMHGPYNINVIMSDRTGLSSFRMQHDMRLVILENDCQGSENRAKPAKTAVHRDTDRAVWEKNRLFTNASLPQALEGQTLHL